MLLPFLTFNVFHYFSLLRYLVCFRAQNIEIYTEPLTAIFPGFHLPLRGFLIDFLQAACFSRRLTNSSNAPKVKIYLLLFLKVYMHNCFYDFASPASRHGLYGIILFHSCCSIQYILVFQVYYSLPVFTKNGKNWKDG